MKRMSLQQQQKRIEKRKLQSEGRQYYSNRWQKKSARCITVTARETLINRLNNRSIYAQFSTSPGLLEETRNASVFKHWYMFNTRFYR